MSSITSRRLGGSPSGLWYVGHATLRSRASKAPYLHRSAAVNRAQISNSQISPQVLFYVIYYPEIEKGPRPVLRHESRVETTLQPVSSGGVRRGGWRVRVGVGILLGMVLVRKALEALVNDVFQNGNDRFLDLH